MSYTNTAARAIELVRDTEYKPVFQDSNLQLHGESKGLANGPGTYSRAPIFAIHIAKNDLTADTHFVRVWFYEHDDDSYVDMNASAFIEGHVYPIYLRKFTIVNGSGTPVTDQDANYQFIGYEAKNMPYELS